MALESNAWFAIASPVASPSDVKVEAGPAVSTSKLKRALDIVGAGIGLLILAPLFLAIALLIKLTSAGPVIFRQRRTGCYGRAFVIYKFRTMTVTEDGDRIIAAKKGDSRTTSVGKFLRRTSMDELPQLLNVLKGEMSLVGPRPHAIAHDRQYAQVVARYNDRFYAKPGISGLAQISGHRGEVRDADHMRERVDIDLRYIGEWSTFLDMKILLLTVLLVAFHKNAY